MSDQLLPSRLMPASDALRPQCGVSAICSFYCGPNERPEPYLGTPSRGEPRERTPTPSVSWLRIVRTECLDRVFVVIERHLESVLKTYLDRYNREPPHRGLDLRIPEGGPPVSLAGATGLGRSCAAIASVALSTNTIGRLRKPFHEYRTAVLDTA
jgi:hypothetical protein